MFHIGGVERCVLLDEIAQGRHVDSPPSRRTAGSALFRRLGAAGSLPPVRCGRFGAAGSGAAGRRADRIQLKA
jgi:hypothetical protein